MRLLDCPGTHDFLVTDAEHLFNNDWQRFNQSILLSPSQLSYQLQNREYRLLSLSDVGGVRLILKSVVLEDGQTLKCNFDNILQMLANKSARVYFRFELIGEHLQDS